MGLSDSPWMREAECVATGRGLSLSPQDGEQRLSMSPSKDREAEIVATGEGGVELVAPGSRGEATEKVEAWRCEEARQTGSAHQEDVTRDEDMKSAGDAAGCRSSVSASSLVSGEPEVGERVRIRKGRGGRGRSRKWRASAAPQNSPLRDLRVWDISGGGIAAPGWRHASGGLETRGGGCPEGKLHAASDRDLRVAQLAAEVAGLRAALTQRDAAAAPMLAELSTLRKEMVALRAKTDAQRVAKLEDDVCALQDNDKKRAQAVERVKRELQQELDCVKRQAAENQRLFAKQLALAGDKSRMDHERLKRQVVAAAREHDAAMSAVREEFRDWKEAVAPGLFRHEVSGVGGVPQVGCALMYDCSSSSHAGAGAGVGYGVGGCPGSHSHVSSQGGTVGIGFSGHGFPGHMQGWDSLGGYGYATQPGGGGVVGSPGGPCVGTVEGLGFMRGAAAPSGGRFSGYGM